MPRIGVVWAGVIAAIVAVLVGGIAAAQTATATGQAGRPLALLAGLRPPHETKAHVKTAHRNSKKIKPIAVNKAMKNNKLAGNTDPEIAAAPAPQAAPQPAQTTLPADVWPVAEATPRADTATASPPQLAAPDNQAEPNEIVVGGQTVQIAAPDQANAIDLAADDNHDTAPAVLRDDRADAVDAADAADAAAAPTVLAAPLQEQNNAVGSPSWIAQILAALGGALAAGAVARFLIGSGPVRTYG
ncbi:MAG TPA: hypothetical protein VEF90_07085 [Xanthobacteraceae bacterium]|nr:hypothetical protein [Xanthobacteraceae bacterium]